ncbi:nicotinamide phosphoribosyl transferase [Colwellia phage 9A]|uniref:Nicotinamide phosphoribosyltransferase n=1 Tax=Colwellia phage 9A TaxID=765765 RepID=I3UM97_9CAUD|nr:nicotinamide phosphoribosyl transferase [Colwellia phage 9A]AFK66612.1 nicotinamide phosphoribosyl transferase [Colwellia phage 9A]
MLNRNLCILFDGYKASQPQQLPKGAKRAFFYIEPRKGGIFDAMIHDGSKYLMMLIEAGVTKADVDEAYIYWGNFYGDFTIFNREGWMRIVNEFGGRLPVTIRCVKEGALIPTNNPVFTIETDLEFAWLGSAPETLSLKTIYYPSTVSTISFEAKVVLKKALQDSSDLEGDAFEQCLLTRLIDFGQRSASSTETSSLGGCGHLKHFNASDTVDGAILTHRLYHHMLTNIMIPAREHSTTTCYKRIMHEMLLPEDEDEAFYNSVEEFGHGAFAIVIDSRSTREALNRLTNPSGRFMKRLRELGGHCVFRPDSGVPVEQVAMVLWALWDNVGTQDINSKGYKTLDPQVSMLQGDGVDSQGMKDIIMTIVYEMCFSQECFNFGMGGGLLQAPQRDDGRWAMKMSALDVENEDGWREVFKAPETDPTKRSKAGRMDLILTRDLQYVTVKLPDHVQSHPDSVMVTIYSDFNVNWEQFNSFEEIRYLSDFQS